MSVISILAFPFTILEYYFTRERVTEESASGKQAAIPIRKQLAAVFTDKFWLIIIIYFLVYTAGSMLKNISLVYYCNYVLGSYNDGITQTLVSTIGGIPMGIGIFAVWPLAKKFGKRNVTLAGFVLYALGGVICLLGPRSMTVVLVGQFIKNIGGLPCAYVFMALFADVLDHIEWKAGFRCDGLSTSIYTIILTVSAGLCNGVFNLLIAGAGYTAPNFNASTGETIASVQNAATQDVFTFCFLGFEIITAVVLIALLIFLTVEKGLQQKQDEIKARLNAGTEGTK
jgi:GPH family glycoside/pentoside/hexuronide:cation symporter